MKKQTVTIEEVLKAPYPEEHVPVFKIGENVPIPMFGEISIEILRDFATLAHQLLLKEPFIVFWGLSGNLGNFYSKVKDPDLTMDMLTLKINYAKPMQPFNVHREKGFELLVEKLGGIQSLREIDFEEAMLIVQGKKAAPQMKYEESDDEESDFDDDCVADCKPGFHVCGK